MATRKWVLALLLGCLLALSLFSHRGAVVRAQDDLNDAVQEAVDDLLDSNDGDTTPADDGGVGGDTTPTDNSGDSGDSGDPASPADNSGDSGNSDPVGEDPRDDNEVDSGSDSTPTGGDSGDGDDGSITLDIIEDTQSGNDDNDDEDSSTPNDPRDEPDNGDDDEEDLTNIIITAPEDDSDSGDGDSGGSQDDGGEIIVVQPDPAPEDNNNNDDNNGGSGDIVVVQPDPEPEPEPEADNNDPVVINDPEPENDNDNDNDDDDGNDNGGGADIVVNDPEPEQDTTPDTDIVVVAPEDESDTTDGLITPDDSPDIEVNTGDNGADVEDDEDTEAGQVGTGVADDVDAAETEDQAEIDLDEVATIETDDGEALVVDPTEIFDGTEAIDEDGEVVPVTVASTPAGGGGGTIFFYQPPQTGAPWWEARNRFRARAPRFRPARARSLRGMVNPLRNQRVAPTGPPPGAAGGPSGGGATIGVNTASGRAANQCPRCDAVNKVSVRLHPAYGASIECGRCVEGIHLALRFPDQSLDTFDPIAFQDSLAEYLQVDYEKIYIETIEEGSVIVSLVVLPTWVFEVPPNATITNRTGEDQASDDGSSFGLYTDPKEGEEGNATEATFRSKGANATEAADAPFDPTDNDYSEMTLQQLDRLLSSYYLPGMGGFSSISTTPAKHCSIFEKSKDEVRARIASELVGATVWGKEAPRVVDVNAGFDGGAMAAAKMVFEAANATMPKNIVGQSAVRSLAQMDVGSVVELSTPPMMITLGMANFSTSQNCTECTCKSFVDTHQPFLNVMNFEY